MVKIKIFIVYTIYKIIDFFIFPTEKIMKNTLLIVRLDAIGDYILFRNFIEEIKYNSKYKQYRITLIGNDTWKELAIDLDSKYINQFIWINRIKFDKNLYYRYTKLKEITSVGYEIIINPTFSREYSDQIIKLLNAQQIIGSEGDFSAISLKKQKNSNRYYTKLIATESNVIFEFYRNKEFFQNLLNIEINIKKPTITLKKRELNFILPDRYAIFFIGASASYRKWNIENFVKIAKFIKGSYNYEIVLCGGPTDLKEAKKFKKLANFNYFNLVGETSLLDFLYIIDKGSLMLSNETSAPHFAVALEMRNIFVISNGNHYGRFTPYPKEICKNYYPIYHPKIEKDIDNEQKVSNIYGYGSRLDINEISVNMLKEKIVEVLS